MSMKKLALAAVVCVALAGCGDDKDPGNPLEEAMRGNNPGGMPSGMPTGMPPMMPGGLPSGLPGPDMLKTGGTIKLTDEMMERYVAAIKELGGIDGMPTAALLARHKFDIAQWTGVNQIIGGSMARSTMSGMRPSLEKSLADLKKRRDAADAKMRPMYDAQIQAIEGQLKSLGDVGEPNEVDKHNMTVLKRWEDRIDKAGGR